MPATYRSVQTDFSGGVLDPLAIYNLNSGLRTIGVRSSINTIHLPSGAIRKREPSSVKLISDGIAGRIANKVEMMLGDRTVNILFPEDSTIDPQIVVMQSDGTVTRHAWHSNINHAGSKYAVYQNQFVEVNENFLPYLHQIVFIDGSPVMTSTQMQAGNWHYAGFPTSCCIAQGRLLLSVGNTLLASRSPEGESMRFFDFTLSDNTYSYRITIDHGSVGTGITGRSILYFERETEIAAGSYTLAQYLAMDGLVKREDILTDTTGGTENTGEVDNGGNIVTRTYSKKIYTVTYNYTGGIANFTDIVVETHVTAIGSAAVSLVVREGTSTYPSTSIDNSPDTAPAGNPEMSPVVYSSHAVELIENDLYASEIQWIANLGRIIVATKTALFISTSDIITPADFDLTPTAYVGSSHLQPKILNNWLIWASLDRTKLYGAIYSNEIQGLTTVEITSNVHHLFASKIMAYEMTDAPIQTIYALTEAGTLNSCTLVQRDGIIFSWSTWELAEKVNYIAYDRTMSSVQSLILGMQTGTLLSVERKEIYAYGQHGIELYADYISSYSVSNAEDNKSYIFAIPSGYIKNAEVVEAVIEAAGQLPIVRRSLPVSGGMVDIGIIKPGYENFTLTLGIPYRMEIGLISQIMPNNSGTALQSMSSVSRIDMQLYKSLGGQVQSFSTERAEIKQLVYGVTKYRDSLIDDNGNPISFTGLYGVDNPATTSTDAMLKIVSDDPYPFNLMAVAQTIRLTEVY